MAWRPGWSIPAATDYHDMAGRGHRRDGRNERTNFAPEVGKNYEWATFAHRPNYLVEIRDSHRIISCLEETIEVWKSEHLRPTPRQGPQPAPRRHLLHSTF
jgi:hypothetical protein